jgi:two-component system, sensor histidine kinase and response regulator
MPEINGFELCSIIKKDPQLADIPIIFLTALSDIENILKGFAVGGVDYITKPFREAELTVRVKNHLDLARARKQILRTSQELRALNNTNNQVMSLIGHDMRTPMASMGMLLSSLSNLDFSKNEEYLRKNLKLMESLVNETSQMFDNLLQWSRMQMGRINCAPTPMDIVETIQLTLELYTIITQQKNISLTTNMPKHGIVFADEDMVKTVIRNLLSNAIKFTAANGHITISVTVGETDCCVAIADNGRGLTDEWIARIFSDTEYQSSTGTQGERGSGLGLKICKNFIAQNHGQLWVESELNKGSVFYFTLPNKR